MTKIQRNVGVAVIYPLTQPILGSLNCNSGGSDDIFDLLVNTKTATCAWRASDS